MLCLGIYSCVCGKIKFSIILLDSMSFGKDRRVEIPIKKFKPRKMPHNSVCLLIGKRRTGKSELAKDVLYYFRKVFPMVFVMSGTEEGNGFYSSIIPDLFIYSEFDPEQLKKILKRQKKKKKKGDNTPVAILLDDCMYDDKAISQNKEVTEIFMNGRHWNIFLMITAQYVMALPPKLRGQADYVFCLKENVAENRQKLFKHFFGIFPDYNAFSKVMTQCTENFECIVLDNTSTSSNIEDCVFWYKATLGKRFRMCCRSAWEYSKKNYNKNWDISDDETEMKTNVFDQVQKKNQTQIIVKKSHKRGRKS